MIQDKYKNNVKDEKRKRKKKSKGKNIHKVISTFTFKID